VREGGNVQVGNVRTPFSVGFGLFFIFIYLIFQEICNKTVINVNEVKDARSMVVTGYKTANVTPELN